MPSGAHGLDSRRLKDVKPRSVRADDGENYALENFKYRVQHRRLVELVGKEEADAIERAHAAFRKEWAAGMNQALQAQARR